MKFTVTITRSEYKTRNFQVEADSEAHAATAAMDYAANYEWGSGEAEYEIEGIKVKK